MALEFKSGQMELAMRVSGDIIRQVDEVSSGTSTGISLKESGSMIRPMALEFTPT